MIVEFKASPGDAITQAVEIRNTGTQPLRLNLYRKDFLMELSGYEQELEPGEGTSSISPYLLASPEGIIDLSPGQKEYIRFTFTPPQEANGTLSGKFFVQEISTPQPLEQEKENQKVRLFIKQRWEVRLHGTVVNQPDKKEGDILTMKLEKTEKDESLITVQVKNLGDYLLRCQGALTLKNEEGKTVFEGKVGNEGQFVVYPHLTRQVAALLPNSLSKGRYLALAIIDTGDEELLAGEMEIEIN